MYTVLLAIHIMIALALIVIILVQRSAGDGMGLSASSSTSFMSGRAAATFVTRATAVLGALFILSSLGLGFITAHNHTATASIMDRINANAPAAPKEAPAVTTTAPAQEAPAKKPAKPVVPRPE